MVTGNGHIKWRLAILGFIAAIGVFAVLFWLIDVNRFLRALGQATPAVIGVMVVGALGWLLAWSLVLRTVLGVIDVKVPLGRSFLVYTSALFSDNITPFGQAGGEPVAAVFISRVSDISYETALASISSVDAINFAPSITLALLGLIYYTLFQTVGDALVFAEILVVAVSILVPTVLYFAWRYRYRLGLRIVTVLTPVLRRISRVIPQVTPPEPAVLELYVENFFASIERITSDRRGIAVALVFSTIGWLLQICLLWLSFVALGRHIPFTVALLVIPLAATASVVPLPGGLGAVDAALIGLLSTLTGVDLAVITAAIVVHRGLVYGLPTLIGGSTIALISAGTFPTGEKTPRQR